MNLNFKRYLYCEIKAPCFLSLIFVCDKLV
jgi:hypothetical protein